MTPKLSYNYTHTIYNQNLQIIAWVINGKQIVNEPFRPLPIDFTLTQLFTDPKIGGYIRLEANDLD
jgi:hypothetical protein